MSPESAKAVPFATRIGFLMIVEKENYNYSWKTRLRFTLVCYWAHGTGPLLNTLQFVGSVSAEHL